jgi:RHS repeat-associated protein
MDSYRVSSVSLPGGASTSAVSEQNFGYGGQYSANYATLASSIVPSDTDPNGNTSDYQTDAFGNPIGETDAAGNTTTIQRDANGLPTAITLPPPATGDAGPVTDIYYTSTGDETYATGAQPTYGTYTYTADSFGQWATFTDVTGKEWVRSFDTHGDMLSLTDPSGNEVSWTYDTYGQPLTMTIPAPNNAAGTVTVTYHYDSDERLTEIVWPDNTNEQFGYNADDRQTTYQDENGHTTTTAFDVLGRIVSVTNAAGGVTSTTYDKDNNVLTTTTPQNEATSDQYNARNELVQQTLPAPVTGGTAPVLAWTYDANGNALTFTDSLNEVTSMTWDKMNRMVSETLPAPAQGQSGPETTFGYDNLSHKVSETTALGTTTWAYANTDVNQLTSETLPAPSGSGNGPTTSFFYDSDGRQNQVENALSQYTTAAFTADGQTASVTDNLNHTVSYAYGHGGELLSTTDANSHTTSDEYDSRYRLIQITDANGGATKLTLDGVGNTTALVDPANNQTTWTFSPVNLPLTETNALGTTTNTFNLDGLTTSIQDADGRVRDFVYNNDQQLTAENWMSGSTVVAAMAYGYDLAGQLTSASDASSAYAFSYDGDGNVLTTDNAGTPNVPHVVLTNTYDSLGDRLTQSATIAGTVDFLNSYTYNNDQELTTAAQQGQNGGDVISPKEIDYAYNALGQFTDVWDYNTLSGPRVNVLHGAFSYDTGARLTGIAYTSNGGATTIDTLGWGYDAANNVTSFSSIDGSATYGYDPTNQLTSAVYTTASGGHQPANESFSFDLNGNRNSTGYTTSSDNLLTSDGTFDYQHDADGNTTVRTRISNSYATDYQTTYTWDYRNRLTDVEYYDNNSVLTGHVHYVYDVFDHLLAAEVDPNGGGQYTSIQHYALDVSPEIPAAGAPGTANAQPVLVFDGSGNLIDRNLVAPDPAGVDAVMVQGTVISTSQGDTDIFAADDNLGTPRDEVNTTGSLVNHEVFSAFGQDVYSSAPAVTYWAGFAGGHVDPNTGLVNNYHRWYDPATGRWISDDPRRFAAGDANELRYVRNSPAVAYDPIGLAGMPPTYTTNEKYYQDLLKNQQDNKAKIGMTIMKSIVENLKRRNATIQQENADLQQYMQNKWNLDLKKIHL